TWAVISMTVGRLGAQVIQSDDCRPPVGQLQQDSDIVFCARIIVECFVALHGCRLSNSRPCRVNNEIDGMNSNPRNCSTISFPLFIEPRPVFAEFVGLLRGG